jgi:hypothetical protein
MASVTVGVGPVSVTQDNAWDSLWNSVYNESTTFRNMPDSAKDAANQYKADLRTAITKQDPAAARSALNSMANIYDQQAKLVGGSGTEQGRNLQQLAKNCRTIGKSLTKENIRDLRIERGTITQNNTGNGESSNANDALITAFADSNGKVDLNSAKEELDKAGYSKEAIASFEKACTESDVVKESTLATAGKSKESQAQA